MHLPSQGLGGERFRKDRVSRLERRPTKLFELGANNREARHVEHLRVGAPASQLARQFDAVETGHHDVGQQQVYRLGVGLRDSERFFAIRGFQDSIACRHETVSGQRADICLVINDQDSLHVRLPRLSAGTLPRLAVSYRRDGAGRSAGRTYTSSRETG